VNLRSILGVALAAAILGGTTVARATIVERVVAIIGERPILWTELLHRAVATRMQIRTQTRDPNVIGVQEQEMYKELLERMINDRLEEQQADKAHVTVTSEEIDRGITNIANAAAQEQGRSVTIADVLDEVHRRGMTEQDFRDEIRRQIIEGKLVELRVRPRVRVTDSDAHAAYQHWASQMKDQQPMDVRILALRLSSASSKMQVEARMALAQELVRRARSGEDFCQLVTQYSDDVSTRATCGSHGVQPIANLMPAIQEALRDLPEGAVSEPIPISVGSEGVLVILMPMGSTKVPPFDDVKNDMMQRALLEGIERARKEWLQDLRRSAYVDVRL
jgi:peptidyl-prolyl cis-trans isomerase SurA